jgi:3-dehydrosphinganine reductase
MESSLLSLSLVVVLTYTAGMVGIIGYSTYSPTKFALRGLADVLRNEMAPYGVKVSIVYPPDTDTPGFREEMKTKPPACKEISEFGQGEPFPAESVAMNVVSKVTCNAFFASSSINVGFVY